MTRYEYMRLKLSNMPDNVITHNHLLNIATPNWYVYCKIRQGMYGPRKQGSLCRNYWQTEQNNAWAVDT
jgi:hypothetical protein